MCNVIYNIHIYVVDFPGGSGVKETANAGDAEMWVDP